MSSKKDIAKPNFVETWTSLHILFLLFKAIVLTWYKHLSIYCVGYLPASRRCLKFARHSSDSSRVDFEEIVQSNLIASPLIKPLFIHGGWFEVKYVYWKGSLLPGKALTIWWVGLSQLQAKWGFDQCSLKNKVNCPGGGNCMSEQFWISRIL